MLALSILILFILSFQVMPVALGMDVRKTQPLNLASGVLFIILGQVLFFLFGIWLGNSFMHLLSGIRAAVLFVGFSLIGVRFVMEAFNIRKGERTYSVERPLLFILPAIAQAVNTFLAGLLFYFLSTNLTNDLIYLSVFSFSLSLLFVFIKNNKLALSAISLLYLVGGGILTLISFYFVFA